MVLRRKRREAALEQLRPVPGADDHGRGEAHRRVVTRETPGGERDAQGPEQRFDSGVPRVARGSVRTLAQEPDRLPRQPYDSPDVAAMAAVVTRLEQLEVDDLRAHDPDAPLRPRRHPPRPRAHAAGAPRERRLPRRGRSARRRAPSPTGDPAAPAQPSPPPSPGPATRAPAGRAAAAPTDHRNRGRPGRSRAAAPRRPATP